MKTVTPQIPEDSSEEIAALIETLHTTGQRLEQLTGGEVDTVANRAGETFLLRHAQDQLRLNESAKQDAILNALPASIALLDSQGKILSVNEAWHQFGSANAAHCPGHDVGVNYLTVCDKARGDDAAEAGPAAAGIRAVLNGKASTYTLEYPCHSPTEQRWFMMTVTPLTGYASKGVVVMHLNITTGKLAENSLRESEKEFQTLAESMPQIVWITRPDDWCIYLNQHWMDYTGLTLEESLGHGWNKQFPPDERQHVREAWQKANGTHGIYSIESRLRRADGEYRWWLVRSVPLLGADDIILKWFGTCTDIHDLKMAGLEIEAERARLVAAQRVAKVGSWETDLATLKVTWSDETYRIFEAEAANLQPTHQDFLKYVHPEDCADVDEAFIQSLNLRSAGVVEHRLLFPDERIKFVEENWQIIFDDQGKPTRAIGTCQDITERKKAEIKISQLNRVLLVLSSINTLIVRVEGRDELFREACNIAVDAGGFRMAMIGIVDPGTMRIIPVATAGKDEELVTAIKSILSSGEFASNTMVARAIREKRAVVSNDSQSDPQVLLGPKYAEVGVRSIVILPLIISGQAIGALALYAAEIGFFLEEELKLLNELACDIAFSINYIEQQDRLNYLAYYDVLTGLANRILFLERVTQFMDSAEIGGHKLAIALIDLERFKSINDSLGRPAGDALLKQVANWLTRRTRNANLLARIDADHFAIVLPEIKSDGNLEKLVDNFMNAFLEHPFPLNDVVLRLGINVGIALFPDSGGDADSLFISAEAALKKAKKSGDRCLYHTQQMTASVASNLTLENQLRQAIDNEEFLLHYQPKLNLLSGMITGAEALIRWNDPHRGLVPPGLFIPILEETGLIYEVGRWALRKAIDDSSRWRAAGLASIRIAVNVSPLQLRNSNFIDEISKAISIDANAGDRLELEITESVIMNNIDFNIANLRTIRSMGITIAIDDFGTGFSSLSYLAKLPVDTLKIDRSFVIAMDTAEGIALVSTIIALAHTLKLKVVAEGVETQKQSRQLLSLKCDEMQGFLFSKPLPIERFEELLRIQSVQESIL